MRFRSIALTLATLGSVCACSSGTGAEGSASVDAIANEGSETEEVEEPEAGVPTNEPWTSSAEGNRASIGVGYNDGPSLSGGCNKLLGSGYQFSLYDYKGDSLKRVDDQQEPTTWALFDSEGGSVASYNKPMHYFAPDEAWVLSEALPAAFGDALGRSNRLSIMNGAGQTVLEFNTVNAMDAVSATAEVCQ